MIALADKIINLEKTTKAIISMYVILTAVSASFFVMVKDYWNVANQHLEVSFGVTFIVFCAVVTHLLLREFKNIDLKHEEHRIAIDNLASMFTEVVHTQTKDTLLAFQGKLHRVVTENQSVDRDLVRAYEKEYVQLVFLVEKHKINSFTDYYMSEASKYLEQLKSKIHT